MAHSEISTTSHAATFYRSENAETRYRSVLMAALPAAAILFAAATVLGRLLVA